MTAALVSLDLGLVDAGVVCLNSRSARPSASALPDGVVTLPRRLRFVMGLPLLVAGVRAYPDLAVARLAGQHVQALALAGAVPR